MTSTSFIPLSLSVLLAACGGIIADDDGGLVAADGGADSQNDSPTPPPPPPSCKATGAKCGSSDECCSTVCYYGSCKPPCTTTSDKPCDQCIAANSACCVEMLACNADSVCAPWWVCVQQCEQQGHAALWCLQNACPPAGSQAGNFWYDAQYYCPVCTQN